MVGDRLRRAVMRWGIPVPLVLLAVMASEVAGQPGAELSPDRVAVLQFENVSGVAADEWLGAGIAESVAAGLNGGAGGARVEGGSLRGAMRIQARVPEASAEEEGAVAAGRRLGVRWVVTGAYQRHADQLRLTARILDVSTAAAVGAVTVDGAMGEFFALQDRLVAALTPVVTDAMRVGAGTDLAFETPRPLDLPTELTPSPEEVETRSETTGLVDGAQVRVPAMPQDPGRDQGGSDGPPAPVPPAVITRDADGRATVRAVRVEEALRLDGELDESVYLAVPAITDFVQQAPVEGAPATEQTEVWVLFDEQNLYVSAKMSESIPPSAWIANEMRRDSFQLFQNDTFWVILDTFHDGRNGVGFFANPLGGFTDFAFANEGNPNLDWNPVWNVRSGRFEGGWTLEMAIPFRSLRYRPGEEQVWGVQFRRGMATKNESAYLTPIPISTGQAGVFRVSEAADLVGLELPGASKNLEIKPYGIAGVSTNLTANPPTRNAADGNAGIDVKYGITQNLTADFTYNTDFAQVEVDEQQVNLTRFSLFFPEKREFFLEGAGIFAFARGAQVGGFYTALRRPGGAGFLGGGNAPTLFYSRRIGLQDGAVVPIVGGGRVTGKIGAFDVGLLNIQTDEEATAAAVGTNFGVVRVKRDILRRGSVGGIFTNRSLSQFGDGASQAYGVDATFSFFDDLSVVSYLSKTNTPEHSDKNTSYQGKLEYGGDRYGFQADHLLVEDNFIPEMGFLRRDNFRRTYTTARFSPRPRSLEAIRQVRFEGGFDYIEAADTGAVQTRQSQFGILAEFENGDQAGISVADNYEFLSREFTPGPGVVLPVGGYGFQDLEMTYQAGPRRFITGNFMARVGEYFSGTIRSVGFMRTRLSLTDRFSLEPSISLNWIDTPSGAFRTDLVVSRVNYSFTPRMFFSGLTQFNSASNTLSNNLRLRWEYSPGSEVFVVYTEDRETNPLMPDRYTDLRNRGFVVKVNRLLRF